MSFDNWMYIRVTYITTNGKIYLLSDLSTVQTNSLPRDSITLIIILVHIYLVSDFIDAQTDFRPASMNFHPPVLVILPATLSTINRFSKNRKYDFWVLSRETTFPFDGTSSARVSFSANCRRQVKSGYTFRRTWLRGRRWTEGESANDSNDDIAEGTNLKKKSTKRTVIQIVKSDLATNVIFQDIVFRMCY